ncbi:MAG: tRNA pseudouridine(55) synthase TruB [Thermoanaerobaculia bacterium]
MSLDGLLLVNKPQGMTSHDVVQRARRALGLKRIGHCGTLDPDATGLLVLTVGRATRLTRFLIRAPKVYEGVARLGVTTDTYDAAGEVVGTAPTSAVTEHAIRDAMSALAGSQTQIVPPYSAKKVGGVKHYQLARRGEAVPEATKEVTIFEFEATGPLRDDRLPFRLSCSSGTYARTLVHDLGRELGCGAHLESLSRLQVGPFRLADGADLDQLAGLAPDTAPGTGWIDFDTIPLPFGDVVTDAQQELKIAHGQTILVRDLAAAEGDWVKLLSPRRELIAVGTVAESIGGGRVGVVQPKIVFR